MVLTVVLSQTQVGAQENDPSVKRPCQGVVLRGLNKITAKVSEWPLHVGEVTKFETLRITLKRCVQNPPEELPEAYAYLEIHSQQGKPLFQGWMISTHPSLSALENPEYDVWVKEALQTNEGPEIPSEESKSTEIVPEKKPEDRHPDSAPIFQDPEDTPDGLPLEKESDPIAALYRGMDREQGE